MPQEDKKAITRDMVEKALYRILRNAASTDVQGQAEVAKILLNMISAREIE